MSFDNFPSTNRRTGLLLLFLLITLSLVAPSTSSSIPERITTIDTLESGKYAIDDIENFDMREDSIKEIVYSITDSYYKLFVNDKMQDKKTLKAKSGEDYQEFYGKGIAGIVDWDEDGDNDIIYTYRKFEHFSFGGGSNDDDYLYLKMIDYLENEELLFKNHQGGNDRACGSTGNLYTGLFKGNKELFIYINDTNHCTPPKKLYIVPRGTMEINESYQILNQSWSPKLNKGAAIDDLNNDGELEFIGIDSSKHLLWYDFYNSTPNLFKVNALELMDELYDVDQDGLKEVFYVTPQEKLAWIDVNRENRVTNVNASKLGGVGNWDWDGFKELSFIDPQGNVKIFEFYQLLVTKRVLSTRIGLNQPITVELKIDNNRRINATDISISDSIPDGFHPPSQERNIKINVTKNTTSEVVSVNLSNNSGRGQNFTLTHLDSQLLDRLESQQKLLIKYRMVTPRIPGSYSLPRASFRWQEF